MLDYHVINSSGSQLNESNPTVIKVIGCGGGGCNAVDNMIRENIENVEFIALNTDKQILSHSMAPVKIAIGQKKTGGRGAGGNPEIGEEAAEEDKDSIKNVLSNANMIFITAGMGGGTGTGSAPVVARIARELGALTVCVVTTPFKFEGTPRMKIAIEGIKKLRSEVDSLIIVPNQKLVENDSEKKTLMQSFKESDEVLRQGIQGISDIVTKTGFINTDFADVEAAMKDKGDALLGIGRGSGENRATEAAMNAINNKLLDDVQIDDAKNLLVNITGTSNILLKEIEDIIEIVRGGANPNAKICWGQFVDENMGDEISVTVIATGFKKQHDLEDGMDFEETPQTEAKKYSNIVDYGSFDKIMNGKSKITSEKNKEDLPFTDDDDLEQKQGLKLEPKMRSPKTGVDYRDPAIFRTKNDYPRPINLRRRTEIE